LNRFLFGDDPKKTNMRTSSVVLIILAILTFPLWFGLGVGLFAVLIGVFGGLIGLIFGLVGGLIGVVAWVLKGFFSLLFGGVPWDFNCDWNWPSFEVNGWAIAAIILIIALLVRSRR
jgi:hypothetical protein